MAPTSVTGVFVADEPPEKLGLSQEQKDDILGRLFQKWKGRRECPVCTTNQWEMHEHATVPMTMQGLSGDINLFGPGYIYPQVGLVCSNCGYTLFFNLVTLQMMKARKKEDGPKEEGGPKSDEKNG